MSNHENEVLKEMEMEFKISSPRLKPVGIKKFTFQEFYDKEMWRFIPTWFRCANKIEGVRCTNHTAHQNVYNGDWCEECKKKNVSLIQ